MVKFYKNLKDQIERFLEDFRHNKTLAVFLIVIWISTILGGGIEFFRYRREIFYEGRQAMPGQKFIPLVDKLSGQKIVGFVAQDKQSQEDYWADLFQLQNILVPIIVREGTIPEFIVASGYSTSSINVLEKMTNSKIEIINEFPNQIILLRKK